MMSQMEPDAFRTMQRLIGGIAALLILKVVVVSLWNLIDYVPPDFRAVFLLGREGYFWRGYFVWFYLHVFASPITLIFGMLLVSERFRRWRPRWHRRLGKVQIALVIGVVVPSGIGMSFWHSNGWVGGVALGSLGMVTGICAWCGWRDAVRKRFASHRRWMWRLFVLLCSAVSIRILGGLTEVLQIESATVAVANAWISWVLPLFLCEAALRWKSS